MKSFFKDFSVQRRPDTKLRPVQDKHFTFKIMLSERRNVKTQKSLLEYMKFKFKKKLKTEVKFGLFGFLGFCLNFVECGDCSV